MSLLTLLSLLSFDFASTFTFQPMPNTDYMVDPGFESCNGNVMFLNSEVGTGLYHHTFNLHHGDSFCFTTIETVNGVTKKKPYRISLRLNTQTLLIVKYGVPLPGVLS